MQQTGKRGRRVFGDGVPTSQLPLGSFNISPCIESKSKLHSWQDRCMTNDEATHSVIDWSKHIGLFVGGLTTLIIALRIFGTAHWDLDTAFGILSENGTANVLTGSLLSSLPLVFVAALVIAEPWIWWRYNIGTQAERTGLIFLTRSEEHTSELQS